MSPRCCLWTTRPPLPPGGEGAALMTGDPQRWPLACGLASAAASPWVRGGCALGKGKVRTSDGHKSKDITDTKSYGNGLIRLGGISALCPLLAPHSWLGRRSPCSWKGTWSCGPAAQERAVLPRPEALAPCSVTPQGGKVGGGSPGACPEVPAERSCCARGSQLTSELVGSASPPPPVCPSISPFPLL